MQEVCEQISEAGLRLPCPKICPKDMCEPCKTKDDQLCFIATYRYDIMLYCWTDEAEGRPSFEKLSLILEALTPKIPGGKIEAAKKLTSKSALHRKTIFKLVNSILSSVSTGDLFEDDGYSAPQASSSGSSQASSSQANYVPKSKLDEYATDQKLYTDNVRTYAGFCHLITWSSTFFSAP